MLFFLFFILAFLLLFPETVCSGAKDGLFLWATVVLPSLFPFCLCTSLIRTYTSGSFSKYFLLFAGILPDWCKTFRRTLSKRSSLLSQCCFLFRFYQQCQSDVCDLFCRRLSPEPRKRMLCVLSPAIGFLLPGKLLYLASPSKEAGERPFFTEKCRKKRVHRLLIAF